MLCHDPPADLEHFAGLASEPKRGELPAAKIVIEEGADMRTGKAEFHATEMIPLEDEELGKERSNC